MKTTLFWLIIFLAPGLVNAQTPVIEWLIDDSTIVDFNLDSNNNILTLKKKDTGYEIGKYDNHGSLITTIADTFNINDLKSIRTDHSGNIYIIGNQMVFDRSVSFYVGQGVYRDFDYYHTSFCIAKYDSSGNPLRYLKYKSSSSVTGLVVQSVSFDTRDNMILCAHTTDGDTVNVDTCSFGWREDIWPSGSIYFNAKLDPEGKMAWFMKYPYYIIPNKTITDQDDNMITVGYSRCQLASDSIFGTGCYGLTDGIIIRYDRLGNILRTDHIGSKADDKIMDVSLNNEQELTLSLVMNDTTGTFDGITLQSGGQRCSYGGSGFVVHIGRNGQLLWYRPINSSFQLAGSDTHTLFGLNFQDTVQYLDVRFLSPGINNTGIVKIDGNGNPLWSKQIGSGQYNNQFKKVMADRSGNAFVFGSYFSAIRIDQFDLPAGKGKFLCKLLNGTSSAGYTQYAPVKSQLNIYPNPAGTTITVSSDLPDDAAQLFLYDSHGRELMNRRVEGNAATIDISHLSNGVYLVKLAGSKQSLTGRIVKH